MTRWTPASLAIAVVCVSTPVAQEVEESTAPEPVWLAFSHDAPLVDLMEFWVRERGINLEFDPEQLQHSIQLRTGNGVTTESLWALTNRILAERELACVQVSGEDNLSIVPLAEAPQLARFAPDASTETAGFVKVLHELRHSDVDDTERLLQAILSGSGSQITLLVDSNQVILAGLKSQVVQALDMLSQLDVPKAEVMVHEVHLEHVDPVGMVALLDRVTAARKLSGDPLGGSLIATPESSALLVVATDVEVALWQELIERFDRPESAYTIHYVPRRFGLQETRVLIEEVLSQTMPGRRSAAQIVSDELTGTLIVSGTASQHARIEDLLNRLDSTDGTPSKVLRSIPVRYRDATGLLAMVQDLLGDEPSADADGTTGAGLPTAIPLDAMSLSVDIGTNRIVALGEPRWLQQLEALVGTLDVQQPQVLVEALVLTLTEGQTQDLGVEIQRLASASEAEFLFTGLFGLGSSSPASPSLTPTTGSGFSGAALDPGSFSVLLRALETLNGGRSLTIPKVLVANNGQAALDSVLQTPYTATNASDTVATTSFGGTLDAGTQVTVTPRITDGDRLSLDYSVSLSSFIGDSADPALPPPRQEQSLKSTATIPDGYTVVVGGLEVESTSEATSQIPLLGDIPLLGAAFRSTSQTTTNTRFYVFLRCTVLRRPAFEDLRWLSGEAMAAVELASDLPELQPRAIR